MMSMHLAAALLHASALLHVTHVALDGVMLCYRSSMHAITVLCRAWMSSPCLCIRQGLERHPANLSSARYIDDLLWPYAEGKMQATVNRLGWIRTAPMQESRFVKTQSILYQLDGALFDQPGF